MKKIAIVYPHLTAYVMPLIKKLADTNKANLDILYCQIPENEGFENTVPFEHVNVNWKQTSEIRISKNKLGSYHKGLLSYLLMARPDCMIIWANPRYISFWAALLLGRFAGIKMYVRGHGLFKKKKVGIFYKAIYKLILWLSYRYICYTPQVKNSLLSITHDEKKLPVDFNTLYNDYPVIPAEKTGEEKGIFYLGRIRNGCGIEILIDAVQFINESAGNNIELHIIGDGPLRNFVTKKANELQWIKYYGKVFDQQKISEISRNCRIGCVPGFMGLNVVHMMSLSLPTITHGNLKKHMGPEPEYITHGVNGFLTSEPINMNLVADTINLLWDMPSSKIKNLQNNAQEKYIELSTPSFHERWLNILDLA